MLYIAEKLTEHNNDYESIKYIKTELLKQRNGRKIMFIISDGLPNIKKFPPGIMIDLTKKEIEQCKAENIEIYCFFIGDISAVTLARKIYGENNLIFLNPADLTDKIKNKLKAIIK
jgi:nitric oxide reductase activation protein